MRILIVDQCSSAKKRKEQHEPLDEETIDSKPRRDLVEEDGVASYRAGELYQGRQQQRITEATEILNRAGDTVDRVFISAGFGVVGEDEELPLYDVTFSDMSASEIDKRAAKLGIHKDLQALIVDSDYEVVFFALGSDYFRSAKLGELFPDISEDTFIVFFNQEEFEEEYDKGLSLEARTSQAKAHGTIVVALKGEYLRNFAKHRAAGREVEDVDDIEAYCKEEPVAQTDFDDYSSNSR